MHKQYKEAFSFVVPSESSVERIFDMTKKRKFNLRPFLIAAVIMTFLAVSMVSANAATDGAIAEGIDRAIESVKILINGEEKTPEEVGYEYREETVDGEVIKHYGFEFEGENGEKSGVEFAVSDDGVGIGSYGEVGADGFNAKFQVDGKEIELNVPTTALAE